jgi:hypothetical protein
MKSRITDVASEFRSELGTNLCLLPSIRASFTHDATVNTVYPNNPLTPARTHAHTHTHTHAHALLMNPRKYL